MPGCPTFSGSVETGMSQIGPKQRETAHFLFPEQNTHKLVNMQLRKQKQPCLEGAANVEQAFSENCFQANLLKYTFSVYLKIHLNVYKA